MGPSPSSSSGSSSNLFLADNHHLLQSPVLHRAQQIILFKDAIHQHTEPPTQFPAAITTTNNNNNWETRSVSVQNALRNSPLCRRRRSLESLLQEMLDWTTTTNPSHQQHDDHGVVDFVDNTAQLDVIKHHYQSEFEAVDTLPAPAQQHQQQQQQQQQEILKDYREDSVIHQVVDGEPVTYRGLEGVRQSVAGILAKLPPTTTQFNFEHIAVNHNHAKVEWKAVTPSCTMIGTDSFTFDQDNRIATQTVVALSQSEQSI